MMSIFTDDRERWKLFVEVFKAQEKREAARREELAELVKNVPMPDELVKEIVRLGPKGEQEVMRNHPGYEIDEKLKALASTRAVFEQSHQDLLKALDEFDSFSASPDMYKRSRRNDLNRIRVAVKKELTAFSLAAGTLVYHGHRLREPLRHLGMGEQRKTIVEGGQHAFVIGLRNAIAHGDPTDVGYHISWDVERLTDFTLNSARLLATDRFNADGKAFIKSCGEHVHVRPIANSYAARIERFHAWFDETLERNVPASLADYRRCRRACQAHNTRTSYRIFLPQVLTAQVDPYQHLDKYLTPEQIDEGMKLPMRSRAQVDYFIAAADEDGACDDELRQMIYRLFRVTE